MYQESVFELVTRLVLFGIILLWIGWAILYTSLIILTMWLFKGLKNASAQGIRKA